MIPYGRQEIREEDIEAVAEVLRSDFLTQGPMVPRFEEALARYSGAANAVAVNSATSALHLACIALGLGPGDWLWTSPNTFVASANCALYCGARVDFVDIDPRTYNLSVPALRQKLEAAKKAGCLPKIVVPVHFAGQPCDMVEIHELAGRYGFRIIEDASHAIGARYRNEPVGSCRYSDITVFSFHPVKIITTGEGGSALTNDPELADRMIRLRSHGITREPAQMSKPGEGDWHYEQVELGFNYRLTDIAAALGLSQFQRLDEYIARRHEIAERYDDLLDGMALTRPWQDPDGYSAFHLYVIRLHLTEIARTRAEVFQDLRDEGIGVQVHYIPVHTQPFYQKLGFKDGHAPEAERYFSEAISLPIYPTLSNVQQRQVVETLKSVLA